MGCDSQILLAARLAANAHKGQTRKWGHASDPYILHPMRVAGRVAINPKATTDMIAAAWLHDTAEDCGYTEIDMSVNGVNNEVIRMVLELTNPKMPGVPRAERKEVTRKRLSAASWGARVIKLEDRIDNIRETIYDMYTPQDFVKLYLDESDALLLCLEGTDDELEGELRELILRGKQRE